MKVKDLLEDCSRSFHTIEQDQTVDQALKLMSGYNMSALVVMTKDAAHD
jgi:predicted transcriptional regulator